MLYAKHSLCLIICLAMITLNAFTTSSEAMLVVKRDIIPNERHQVRGLLSIDSIPIEANQARRHDNDVDETLSKRYTWDPRIFGAGSSGDSPESKHPHSMIKKRWSIDRQPLVVKRPKPPPKLKKRDILIHERHQVRNLGNVESGFAVQVDEARQESPTMEESIKRNWSLNYTSLFVTRDEQSTKVERRSPRWSLNYKSKFAGRVDHSQTSIQSNSLLNKRWWLNFRPLMAKGVVHPDRPKLKKRWSTKIKPLRAIHL